MIFFVGNKHNYSKNKMFAYLALIFIKIIISFVKRICLRCRIFLSFVRPLFVKFLVSFKSFSPQNLSDDVTSKILSLIVKNSQVFQCNTIFGCYWCSLLSPRTSRHYFEHFCGITSSQPKNWMDDRFCKKTYYFKKTLLDLLVILFVFINLCWIYMGFFYSQMMIFHK